MEAWWLAQREFGALGDEGLKEQILAMERLLKVTHVELTETL
jgi:hypothetical protein